MTRADSILLRMLVLLCVIAQVGMTMVRSGDRVLCFGAPTAADHACQACPESCAESRSGSCSEPCSDHHCEHRPDSHHHDGCPHDSHHDARHDHDRDHHRRLVDTALPHQHVDDCGTCVDIRVPDDPSRPDQSLGLPPMPPPMLVAVLEFPSPILLSAPPAAPPVEPRGIPPATGLSVTRLRV